MEKFDIVNIIKVIRGNVFDLSLAKEDFTFSQRCKLVDVSMTLPAVFTDDGKSCTEVTTEWFYNHSDLYINKIKIDNWGYWMVEVKSESGDSLSSHLMSLNLGRKVHV